MRRPRCRRRLIPGCWVIPRTAATASGTAAGSADRGQLDHPDPVGEARRPSVRPPPRRAGSCPPRPHRSTSPTDAPRSAASTSVSSDSRPTKLVVGGRRFPGRRIERLSGGKSVRSPGPGPETSSTGWAMSRNRRGPRSTRSTPLSRPAVDAVEQDLAAVPARHHPGGAIEHGAEVVGPPHFGLTGRDAHPHRQRQCPLCRYRRFDRIARRLERRRTCRRLCA